MASPDFRTKCFRSAMRPRIAFKENEAFATGSVCDMTLVCARIGRTRRHIISRRTALTSLLRQRCIGSRFLTQARNWTSCATQPSSWQKTTSSLCRHGLSSPIIIHLVISFHNTATAHRDFVRHLHRELAIQLNRMDATSGRRVMYEFWDTRLTFEKSWLARLNYVHQNPVKHGFVPLANQYPWCSAAWFETNGRPAFVRSVYSFKTDRINVPDDF